MIMIFEEFLKLKVKDFKLVLHEKLHVEQLNRLSQYSFLKVLLGSRLKCRVRFGRKQTH